MRPEQTRIRTLLTEAVTLLCRNSLQFANELTVEGLIGITLDKEDVFLISINELIQSEKALAKINQIEEPCVESNEVVFNSTKFENKSNERIELTDDETVSNIKIEPVDQFSNCSSNTTNNLPTVVKIEKTDTHSDRVQPYQPKEISAPSNNNNINTHYSSGNNQYEPSFESNSAYPCQSSSITSNDSIQIKKETSQEDQSYFILDSDDDNDDFGTSDMDVSQSMDNNKNEFSWSADSTNNMLFNENTDPSSQFSQQALMEGWSNEFMNHQNIQSSSSSNTGTPSSKVSQFFVSLVGDRKNRHRMCVLCEKIIRRPNLYQHYLRMHTDIKAVSCHICRKNFKTKGDLKQHLLVHSDEKSISCPTCGKKFKFRDGLKKHLQTTLGQQCFLTMQGRQK